jgi:hypothetical protein
MREVMEKCKDGEELGEGFRSRLRKLLGGKWGEGGGEKEEKEEEKEKEEKEEEEEGDEKNITRC